MNFIWVLLAAVVTINVTEAKSVIDAENDVSKLPNPSSYAMARRPSMPHRENNFVINLNPTMKTVRQTKLEKYRRPFMKTLLINNLNNKDKVEVTSEVTTRRSLTQRNKFSVKPHDVYANTIHKKYNFNSNTSTYNLEKLKSETNITKGKIQSNSEENGSEEETQNFNSGDVSVNDHDYVDLEKELISNTTNTHYDNGLRKSEKLLLLLPRNISNYLKVNNLQRESENITGFNVGNNHNSNVKVIEGQENTEIFPEVIIKSDSRDHNDKLKEYKENIFDKEEKEQEEYIYGTEVNQKAASSAKRDVFGNGAMTNRQRFRFYRFMRNKSS